MLHRSPYSPDALGDSGPWVLHLPLAWRAASDPRGTHPPPARPERQDIDGLPDRIAWWAPLLHLITFGSGWPRPDLGLQRWLEAGRPTQDPILSVIDRWWGPDSEEILAWALQDGSYFPRLIDVTAEVTSTTVPGGIVRDTTEAIRRRESWKQTWAGGTDPMHLVDHALSAVHKAREPEQFLTGESPTATRPGRATLLLDGYAGWYEALHRHGATLQTDPSERSWRVDVVCRPMGWLGTYRKSRTTGRWFTGQHRWHELGAR